jgi:hypothetical protein
MSDKRGKEKKKKNEEAVNRMTGKKKNCIIDHDICLSVILLIKLYMHQQSHAHMYTALNHTVSFFLSYFLSGYLGDSRKWMINACSSEWVLLFYVDRCISICTDVVFLLRFSFLDG